MARRDDDVSDSADRRLHQEPGPRGPRPELNPTGTLRAQFERRQRLEFKLQAAPANAPDEDYELRRDIDRDPPTAEQLQLDLALEDRVAESYRRDREARDKEYARLCTRERGGVQRDRDINAMAGAFGRRRPS